MSNPNEDLITIKIHGSELERQEIVDRICRYMTDLSEQCLDNFGKTQWGWTLESSREPEL